MYRQNKSVTFLAVKTRLKLRSKFYKVVQLHKRVRLGKLVIQKHFANFLQCVSAKNYKNQLTYVRVMSEHKVGGPFLLRQCNAHYVLRDFSLAVCRV